MRPPAIVELDQNGSSSRGKETLAQQEDSVLVISTRDEIDEAVRRALGDQLFDKTLELAGDAGTAIDLLSNDRFAACVIDVVSVGDRAYRLVGTAAAVNNCPLVAVVSDEQAGIDAVAQGAIDSLLSDEINTRSVRRSLQLALAHGALRRSALVEEEELGRFAALATHDMQAPLRKTLMFLNAFRSELTPDLEPESLELFERALHALGQMRELVSGLFDYSEVSIRGTEPEAVDLTALVDGVIAELTPLISRFSVRIDSEQLGEVMGHPEDLRLVFSNLLLNTIVFRSRDTQPVVTIRAAGSRVVEVIDNGLGFEAVDSDRLFALFQRETSESDYWGAGIGLALCRRVMRSHGGTITAVSNIDGQGSTFRVSFAR